MKWLTKWLRGKSKARQNPAQRVRSRRPQSCRPTVEALEDRQVMSVATDAFRQVVYQLVQQRLAVPASLSALEAAPAGSIPTPSQLDSYESYYFEHTNPELQRDLGGLKELAFGYIPDGCYARAHIMDEILGNHGINNAKLFCLGTLHAGDGNRFFPQGVDWSYHVAPLVVVNDNGTLGLRVVDPAIDQHPITPEDWITRIDPSRSFVQLQVTSRNQYYPERNNQPSGDSFAKNLSGRADTAIEIQKTYMVQIQRIAWNRGLADPGTYYNGVIDSTMFGNYNGALWEYTSAGWYQIWASGVTSFSASPANPDTVYVNVNGALWEHVGRDKNSGWYKVWDSGITGFSASPTEADTVYVNLNGAMWKHTGRNQYAGWTKL